VVKFVIEYHWLYDANIVGPAGHTSFVKSTRGNATVKNEDLTYNEQSSAQGTITAFTKVIVYQSGKSLL
jgi:hypothetical protein